MATLPCQKSLFDLDEGVHYLNDAYMTPNLKSVTAAGIAGVKRKAKPYLLSPEDFFSDVDEVRKLYATLIETDNWQRIALIPSVSYGLAPVIKNVPVKSKGNLVLLSEQFPSNVYAWHRLAREYDLQIRTVQPGQDLFSRYEALNNAVINAIDDQTVAVACAPVHWAHGLKLDLDAIRAKTLRHNAWLVIDGTQAIGALPFSINRIQPDALIIGAYKWLLGPYSLGLAYYGPAMDQGIPVEEGCMNRQDSEIFERLLDYQPENRPYAGRDQVGEVSNFALVPMLKAALLQLLDWGVYSVQQYCQTLIRNPYRELEELGVIIEPEASRAGHLTGLFIPENGFDRAKLTAVLRQRQVYVSNRGSFVRVAPHVYNTPEDLDQLVASIREART